MTHRTYRPPGTAPPRPPAQPLRGRRQRLRLTACGAGLGVPVALALVAGRTLAGPGPGRFNMPAAMVVAAVVVAALATAAGLFGAGPRHPVEPVRQREPARPDGTRDVPDGGMRHPGDAQPGIGTRVRVRTHFTTGGGYVAHGPLLCWATLPRGRAEGLTPETECVVVGVEPDALTIGSLPTEGTT